MRDPGEIGGGRFCLLVWILHDNFDDGYDLVTLFFPLLGSEVSRSGRMDER